MAGTFSISTQCSWTFWRSVRSMVERAQSREISPTAWGLLGGAASAVEADAHHEIRVLQSELSLPVCSPPFCLRCVYMPSHLKRGARSSAGMESKPCFE